MDEFVVLPVLVNELYTNNEIVYSLRKYSEFLLLLA